MAPSTSPGGFRPLEVPVRDQTTLPGFKPIEVVPRTQPTAKAPKGRRRSSTTDTTASPVEKQES